MRLRLDVLRLRLDGGRTSPRAARDGSSLRGLSSCEDDNDDADISLRHTPPQKHPKPPLSRQCALPPPSPTPTSRSPRPSGGVSPKSDFAAAPAATASSPVRTAPVDGIRATMPTTSSKWGCRERQKVSPALPAGRLRAR